MMVAMKRFLRMGAESVLSAANSGSVHLGANSVVSKLPRPEKKSRDPSTIAVARAALPRYRTKICINGISRNRYARPIPPK